MNLHSTNPMDLLTNRIGMGSNAPVEKAARDLAAETSGDAAEEKRWKAALDFEAMFLGQMYKAMRQSATAKGGDLTEAGPGRQIFTEMLDAQYANMNAKNPAIAGSLGLQNAKSGVSNGLAAQVYRSMSREAGADASSVASPSAPAAFSAAPLRAPFAARGGAPGPSRGADGSALSDEALAPLVDLAAKTYELPANLIRSVIKAESNNQPSAVSGAGAKGLMQLMDSTARDMGVRDSFNPRENVMAGARYLKRMLDRFGGDEKMALAAYNAGPATVDRYKGIPPYAETRNYVDKVLGTKRKLDGASASGADAQGAFAAGEGN